MVYEEDRKPVPRVAAIHDLSGVGRCSLTVIMPVLSAMGAQVCPVPTAVLSSHSGGFGSFSFTDLTPQMHGFITPWRTLDLKFDSIYSGFLGSAEQISIVENFIDLFSADSTGTRPLVVVDPVMGDQGKRYQTYTDAMQQKMLGLAAKADLITPNMTEACFLLREPYRPGVKDMTDGRDLVMRLAALGPDSVVVTGVLLEDSSRCNLIYSHGDFQLLKYSHIPVHYPGTGDMFTSVLIGSLLKHGNLHQAVQAATDHVRATVEVTHACGTPEREGVLLERTLGRLMSK